MIFLLAAIICALVVLVFYLNVEFYKEKKKFKTKIEALQQIITEMNKKQLGQLRQLKLSEELEESLKASKSVLSHDIFSLNYELFDLLSKNNLLKK